MAGRGWGLQVVQQRLNAQQSLVGIIETQLQLLLRLQIPPGLRALFLGQQAFLQLQEADGERFRQNGERLQLIRQALAANRMGL
jgi:hypothetical protein